MSSFDTAASQARLRACEGMLTSSRGACHRVHVKRGPMINSAGVSKDGCNVGTCENASAAGRASLLLDAIRRPRDTPLWKLEASLKCRSVRAAMRRRCT